MKYEICNTNTNSTTEYAENNNEAYKYISYHIGKLLKLDKKFYFKDYYLEQKEPKSLNEII